MRNLAVSRDYLIVSYVGVLFGLLLLPILQNIRPAFWSFSAVKVVGIIIGFTFFANVALWVGGWLGTRWPALWQFVKYAATGSLNAVLDVGLLNLLSLIFSVYSGGWLIVFNVISIAIAVTNSFTLNKFWAFKNSNPFHWQELWAFLAVGAVTIVIGSSVLYFLTTIVGSPDGISEPVWENIAKFIATPITIILNFFGFKFLVFKA